MRIFKEVESDIHDNKKERLVAQYSRADEAWLDAVGADSSSDRLNADELKEEFCYRLETILKPFGVKESELDRFEEHNKSLDVGKKIDNSAKITHDKLIEIVGEIEPAEKLKPIENFIDWLNAYTEAYRQYVCHRDMVCGVWSIDAEEFCEKYGLDFMEAQADADEQVWSDQADYSGGKIVEIEKYLGHELSDADADAVREKCDEEYGTQGHKEYLWFRIVGQLENAPAYKNYFEEYCREDYADIFEK